MATNNAQTLFEQLSTGDPETINTVLEWLSPQIFPSNNKLSLRFVHLDELREQDLNAQVMPTAMFNALVSNIQKNQALESVPLCARRVDGNTMEIVSGHHRIRAAREAGHEWVLVMYYDGVTYDEIAAKQLAHNNIAGESNPEIVAKIFERIEGLDAQMEAYVDTEALGKVPDPLSFRPPDIDPLTEAKTVTLVFLPVQFDDWDRAIELLNAREDKVYLAHRDAFDGFKAAVRRTRQELEIVSVPTAVGEMARLVLDTLEPEGEEKEEM